MASAQISGSLYPRGPSQWRQILRATLRECTYLPDPVARAYMQGYVLKRYRHGSKKPAGKKSTDTEADWARTARKGLSLIQRANEGYQRPLEKVLFCSYGRIGEQRHKFLDRLLAADVPTDAKSLKQLVDGPLEYEDGWEPPMIILSLMKSQMNNGLLSSNRVRPNVKSLQPAIPEKNSWGQPLSRNRRRNMRRKWYADALNSVLPPLPDQELAVLDDLISGALPWAPIKRRKKTSSTVAQEDSLLEFLTDGPQKGWTFGKYANGRPHEITNRFMHRQWRRISSLIPRMKWNPISSKWQFFWDSPKISPQLSFSLTEGAELDDIFVSGKQTSAKDSSEDLIKPQTLPRTESSGTQIPG